MNTLRLSATLALVLASTNAGAGDFSGTFLCSVTRFGGHSYAKVGDKSIVAVSTLLSPRIGYIYAGGSGNYANDCEETGSLVNCDTPGSMVRRIIFDTSTLVLTQPFGFENAFTESQCKPLDIDALP
ncbi:hypothetical protein J2X72_003902 [Phyllobacterium sp. 1468]|uniref:hypothetical protein n=1 Tax=Phyllobacterium sp. 1468 TaxID=2817759 RepID=UPI00286679DD|nr:hypothetical protein [Phyllobacterium sp. 1468]MDR6635090.1 hypothetical protein [Phyllobacterium sp. 1468]